MALGIGQIHGARQGGVRLESPLHQARVHLGQAELRPAEEGE